jgi:SnoaL-like domain
MAGSLTISDKFEITEKIHRYCFGVLRHDSDMLHSIAKPDAVVDFGPIYKGDWKGYVEFLMKSHANLLFHSHATGNIIVEGGNGRASSEVVILGILLSRNQDNSVSEVEFRARHLDKWVHEGGHWVIVERALARDYRRVTNVSEQDYATRYVISH